MYEGRVVFTATVEHVLTRADGSVQKSGPDTRTRSVKFSWWKRLHEALKHRGSIPFYAGMSSAAFIEYLMWQPQHGMWFLELAKALPMAGIVTSAGITYIMTVANVLTTFNFHSYGTGDVHGSTSTPTNATAATPSVVTQNSHPFFLNDIIKLTGITGITGVNGIWQLSPVTTNTYTLLGSVGGGSGFGGGTNAAQLLNGQADTALTAEVGSLTRVAGTQTNPSSGVYRSVAAVVFTGTTPPLTIIEWAIFSAASSGTMLDRRWLNSTNSPATTASAALVAGPLTVTQTTDQITTTYNLTGTAGGS